MREYARVIVTSNKYNNVEHSYRFFVGSIFNVLIAVYIHNIFYTLSEIYFTIRQDRDAIDNQRGSRISQRHL